MKQKKNKNKKNKFGTKEWAQVTLNFITGCGNSCKYCFAKAGFAKYKKGKGAEWKNEQVRQHDLKKKIGKYDGIVMFPSTHDIRPEHLKESITFLGKILKAGNQVLVVTKPHLQCIRRICQEFESYKDKIIFRFTIGSADDSVLKFWEPNAPSFKERFDSLKYAYSSGFQTSVSCEPMLDNKIEDVIEKVLPYVTETVWIGKANYLIGKTGRGRLDFNDANDPNTLAKAKELIEWQSDANILELYNLYKDNPKIRWKESIDKIIPAKEFLMRKKVKREITITTVNAPGGCFSCMSAHPVQFEGKQFRTCEAFFQYCRFEGHPAVQEEILNCPSPMGAKMIARRERALLQRDGIWDYADSDRELMKQCLQLKLEQHPDLQQKLIETGNAVIIEDCTTHDREAARIWGAVKVNGKWVGQNILGQLWMELRSELTNKGEIK